MAHEGMRVLAVATRDISPGDSQLSREEAEAHLTLGGWWASTIRRGPKYPTPYADATTPGSASTS
ncbi:hypothetical protein ACFPN0_32115 [Kitasatospora cinereorecta]